MEKKNQKKGEDNEKLFFEIISKDYDIKKSDINTDIYKHIDFYIKGLFNNEISVDLKHNTAFDKNTNIGIYVEIQNVIGNKGWIDGEADYIVFTTNSYFLFVNRILLRNFLKSKLEDKNIYRKKFFAEPYKICNRERKLDHIVFIPLEDIKHIIELYIDK